MNCSFQTGSSVFFLTRVRRAMADVLKQSSQRGSLEPPLLNRFLSAIARPRAYELKVRLVFETG